MMQAALWCSYDNNRLRFQQAHDACAIFLENKNSGDVDGKGSSGIEARQVFYGVEIEVGKREVHNLLRFSAKLWTDYDSRKDTMNEDLLLNLHMEKSKLQDFFDTVVWYGTPFVKNFLNENKDALISECNKDIWEKNGLGFKLQAHLVQLENDYQYLLAFVTYRFAELGAYEFVKQIYKETISHIKEAANLLKIWELTDTKLRSCFTVFGVLCGILSDDVKNEFRIIANENPNLVCGRLAKILLDESYLHEQKLLGRNINEILYELGYENNGSLTLLINSPLCDGIII